MTAQPQLSPVGRHRRKPLIILVFVLIALLLVSALAAAAWWQRAPLVQALLNHMLTPHGVQVQALQDLQVSRPSLSVAHMKVVLPDGSLGEIDGLRLDANLDSLRRGQIDRVNISQLRWLPEIGADGTQQDDTRFDTPGATLGPGALQESLYHLLARGNLPELHVGQLAIAAWPQPFRLTAQAQAGRLNVDLQETGLTDPLQLQLQLDWPETAPWPLQGSLQLADTQRQWPLTFSMTRNNSLLQTWLNLQLDSTELAPLQQRLKRRLAMLDIDLPELPLEGLLHLQLRSQITDQWPPQEPLSFSAIIGAGSEARLSPDWLSSLLPDLRLEQALRLQWSGVAEISLQFDLDAGLQSLSVSGTGLQLAADGALQLPDLRIIDSQIDAERHALNCPQTDSCFFALFGDFSARHVDWLGLALSNPGTDSLRLQGQSNEQQMVLTIDDGLRLELPQIEGLGYVAFNAALALEAPLQIRLPLQQLDALQLQGDALSIELPLIRDGDMMTGLQLQLSRLTMRPLPPISLRAQTALRHVYTNLMPLNLWDARIDGDINWDDDDILFNTTLEFGEERWLQASSHYQLSQQRAVVDWQIPGLTFDPLLQPLSAMINPLPVNMDILAGSLSGEGRLQWQMLDGMPQWRTDLAIAAEDIGGFYEDIGFVDLRTVMRAGIRDGQLSTTERGSLSLARMDPGIPIEQIRFDYRLQGLPLSGQMLHSPWQLTLSNLSLQLFGGSIATDRIDYEHQRERNEVDLRLRQIDLSQVLALSAYEGVSATGLIDGELPVTVSGTTITVSGGQLRARAPGGSIRYRDGPGVTGNPGLDLMYQALENYNYHSLEADVDYLEDGELLLGVRMQGISTEVNRGQRINLNVNISDNIPSLLESLQASRNISEAVRLRLQQGSR